MRVGIDCRKIDDFGIGTYIRGLLREMPEIYVAFGPARLRLPSGVEHVTVDAPNYSVHELFAVGAAADAARLDLFHAPHYVLPQMRTPSVVTIHDLIHLRRGPLQRLYARTMMRRAVRRSRAVVTVSETVKNEIANELAAKNVRVTPNGIEEIFFAEPRPPTSDSPYFLFVGNDKPHKNVDAAVAAIAQIEGAQLVLAGGTFDRFRAHERVICAGFVDQEQLAALYRGAIALVMPSIEEGFGLPAAEAMASGTAVITSNAAALVEVTGDAALHVEPNELRDAMHRVMSDSALRASLVARGRRRASDFTWRECARRTREAYDDVLRGA
jgi:glycosyltransferase involved in cell wall biosynthesis